MLQVSNPDRQWIHYATASRATQLSCGKKQIAAFFILTLNKKHGKVISFFSFYLRFVRFDFVRFEFITQLTKNFDSLFLDEVLD